MRKIKKFLKKSFYALLILSILMVQIDFTFIYAESKEESVEEGASKESSQEEKEITSDEKDENENLLDKEESNDGNVELEEGNKTQEESEEIKEGNENKESEKGEGDTSKDDINKDEKDEDELVNETENEETDSSIFTYDESGTIITGFSGELPKDKIVFPKEHNGKIIIGIGEKAFEGKSISGELIFPETYTKIGKHAFKWNAIDSISITGEAYIGEGAFEKNNLTELDLPKVKKIDKWAFEGNKLESANLPEVESIGEYSFGNYPGSTNKNIIKELDLPKIKEIDEKAFQGASTRVNLSGEISPNFFAYEESDGRLKIKGFKSSNLNIKGEVKFPSKTNNGNDIVGIGESAFERKGIEGHISFPDSYEEIEKWAFKNNEITSISLEGETYIGEGAFEKNNIRELELPKVKEIGPWAFEGNEIESINLLEVSTIGEVAFSNNKLSGELNLPELKNVGDSAFQNNRIEKLDSPGLIVIGDYGFADNKLKEVIAPNLSRLGEWALVGDDHELKSLIINNKLTSVRLSSLYMANEEHLGNFPIYINNSEEKNTIDTDHRIVYNPTDDFKEIYLKSLDNNQEYIWTSVDDFVMGTDRNNNSYYCVDHETPMKQGVYDIYEDVNTIYIIEHGEQNEKGQKVSLDEKPDSYKYSYDGALVSSLITNYYELIEEYEDSIDTGRIYNIIYPVASNPYIEEQVHLTRDNFFDIVNGTDMYKNIYSYEKDGEIKEDEILKKFIVELYERVQNDERDYSKLSYLILSDRDDNIVNLSQSLVKPGEPEDPKEPDKPIIPEPEDPNKPEDPEEPDKPEDPEEPDKPEDPEEPDKPEDPEEPDKPEDPEEPDKPEDPEEPDKPEDPEEPDTPEDPKEDEDGSKNPNKPGEDDEDEDQSWKKPINPNNPGNETSNNEEGGFSLPKTGQSDSLLLLTLGMFLIFLGIKVDKKYE